MAFSPIPGLTLPKGTSLVPANTKIAAPNKTTQAAQTAKAATKTVVTPDPYAKALASLASQPSLATLLAQASTQANALATKQVNAQVAAIQAQQQAAHDQAAAQSAEILKASTAAAQFLTPLGDQAAGDYNTAVQNLGGMVGGYTGGLRDTAQAAQDAAQAQLAGISGNTQTVEGQGANLANLLYGVSGSIPANALATQGLGATALARAIPQQTLSYGQQQAIGQIGAGNTAADALNTQLATARAQLPTLTSQYLTQFQTSARDAASSAHQALMDANTIRNTTSEIAARTATGKRLTKAAADKAKVDAAKLLVPDATQTKLAGGILTGAGGKPITKTVKGVQFLQTAPGYHFDNTGRPVPDPKPTDPAKIAKLALDWSTHLHYRTDSAGNALLFHGKKQPIAPYILDPNDPTGQTVIPRTAAAKPFIPKIDRIGSTATKKLTYVGEDGALHYFYDENHNTIPYDPTKPAALRLFNSGGIAAVFDPNTRTTTKLVDDNHVPLPWGTPKTPAAVRYGKPWADADTGTFWNFNPQTGVPFDTGKPAPQTAVHYGKPYPGNNGNFWNTDPKTGVPFDTGKPAPASALAQGTWSNSPPDKNGVIWQTNSKTGEVRKTIIPGRVPAQAVGTYSNLKVGNTLWRINSVTNKRINTHIPWPTSAHGALSAEATQSYTERINAQLRAMENGIPADPNKGTPARPPVTSRSEAKARLDHAGYMTRALKPLAMAILNEYYPLHGASGHNWFRVTNPALSGG